MDDDVDEVVVPAPAAAPAAAPPGDKTEGALFSFAGGLAGLSNADTPPTVGCFSVVVDLLVLVMGVVVLPDAAVTAAGTATVVVTDPALPALDITAAAAAVAVVAAVEHNFNLSIPANSTGIGPLGTTA